MEKRIIVSGDDAIRELLPGRAPGRRIQLEGSGALCTGRKEIFCACSWGDMIWRLDAERLVPTGLFAGGPGVSELLLSDDGRRLYALCSDADSLLMLSAETGAPMMVNRAGVNPQSMTMDGDVLAVAGGEYAATVLLCAKTLDVMAQLPMPGIVFCAALSRGTVYSLCLDETLCSTLMTVSPGGARRTLKLCGMPGALLATEHALLAATHEHLYSVALDGSRVLRERAAVGRPGKLIAQGERLLACDTLSEGMFELGARGEWRRVMERVSHAALFCPRDE